MTLRKSIWIDAPPALVQSYFTDAEKLSQWSGQAAELDARPGRIYRLDMGEGGWFNGRFTDVQDGFVAWEVDLPGDAGKTTITVRLNAEAGGTRVEVEQTGLPVPIGPIASRGWDHHLARLSVVSTGGKVPPDPLCSRPMGTMADPRDA